MTDLIILATLLAGRKHGYQLKHEAGVILGQGTLHNNLVYPLLRQFMTRKWVKRKAVPGERGQTKNQYSLTVLGRKALQSRLSTFTDQDARSTEEFRLRVGMFWFLERQVRLQILEARLKFLSNRLSTLTNIQNSFTLDRYQGEVTTHTAAEAEAEIKWIERLRRFEKKAREESLHE
jgi:DNA-binding PadR family transcriptional regulator